VNRTTSGRAFAAATAAVVTVGVVLPFVFRASHNPDEDQYAWSAAYYGKKVLAGDFSRRGSDIWVDPGWDPRSYWGRSMGTRAVYALGVATPWAQAPRAPYSYTERDRQGPETRLDRRSLVALRLLALLCAALGAAMLAWRFGWPGALAVGVLLMLPQNAENFARAWAGGPLLLAFGVTAAAYGSRRFPFVLGAVSTVKFTAVGLWPLLLFRSAHGWRSRFLALAATVATWVLLTPPSWYREGPGLLLSLAGVRVAEYSAGQSTDGGLFMPARYLWPFELAALLAVTVWVTRRRRDPARRVTPYVGPRAADVGPAERPVESGVPRLVGDGSRPA
jgi:hypothetical protein